MPVNSAPTRLGIPRPIYQVMLAHLQTTYPQEGCGFLAGKVDAAGHTAHVTQLSVVENRLCSPTAYEMEPEQQLQAMLSGEAHGEQILAVYHSHPYGPAFPSATDLAQAYYPELIYVIVSLQQRAHPIARAFYLRGQTVHLEVQLLRRS